MRFILIIYVLIFGLLIVGLVIGSAEARYILIGDLIAQPASTVAAVA